MEGYGPAIYGERIAEVYDACYGGYEEATIDLLAELAQRGPALELGIGTGRIALPLAARGVAVQGIDTSPAMVGKLRDKTGGGAIPITMGDFADVAVEGQFTLIFAVLNTFCALLSQEEQVRCFRNVVRHLAPERVLVIEAFVPDLAQFTRGQYTVTSVIETDRVELDTGRLDSVQQRTTHQHVTITERGIQLCPVHLRYVWPSELDLMAQLAGLRLRHRWGGWGREPFTAASDRHVSVYTWPPGG